METPADLPIAPARRLTRGFLALVAALVLYVLSTGPVIVSGWAFNFPPDGVFESLYAPLWFLAHRTSTADPLSEYISGWLVLCAPVHGYKYGNPHWLHYWVPDPGFVE